MWEETLQGKGPFSESSKLFRCSNGSESAGPACLRACRRRSQRRLRKRTAPCRCLERHPGSCRELCSEAGVKRKGGSWKRSDKAKKGSGGQWLLWPAESGMRPASPGFSGSSCAGSSSSRATTGRHREIWFSVMEALYGLVKRQFHEVKQLEKD